MPGIISAISKKGVIYLWSRISFAQIFQKRAAIIFYLFDGAVRRRRMKRVCLDFGKSFSIAIPGSNVGGECSARYVFKNHIQISMNISSYFTPVNCLIKLRKKREVFFFEMAPLL